MHKLVLLCCILGIYFTNAQYNQLASIKLNGITHEAEDAFTYRHDYRTKVSAPSCDIDKDLLSGSFVPIMSESYIIFTVNIPQDGVYPVTLRAFACDSKVTIVQIFANGLPLVDTELELKDGVTTHHLALRTGLNTIHYKVFGGSVAFDFISVKGGIRLAERGATTGYEQIEAEDSAYSGTVVGPGRTYCTLPSEASARKAISIQGSSGYVEFTPTQPFNAIVLRFSIPNTPDGKGQEANLSLLVNGNAVASLNTTSYYSWVYGSYPFSKNPGDGNPHHFYDDVRYFFGTTTYPAGTKVRFVPQTSVVYTIDLVDFYNVGPAYPQPANSLSVTDYGADPSGGKDSFTPFNNAIAAASSAGKVVWIPEGKYIFSMRITVNKVTIRGAGPWYTELHGDDFGFFGTWAPNPSTGVQLYDFAIFGQTVTRNDQEISSGAGGSLDNTIIQNIWIEHNKCGMWLDGPFDSLLVTGVTIRNTFADGINFHKGVTNSAVEQSILRNVGDDALAMWAEAPGTYQNNSFRFNTLSIPILANTIGIYGGQDNSATDNVCVDTIVEGAGLQVGTRYNSVPIAGTTNFARNTLIRTGSGSMYDPNSKGFGQIWIYSDNQPVETPIVFVDINATDAYYQGIGFYQSRFTNINFTNIYINGAQYALEERQPCIIYVSYVVAVNITGAGQWICPNLANPFVINYGPGNSGWNTSVSGNC